MTGNSDIENSHLHRTVRITDLKADDRPREKAIRLGVKSLSDAELIALELGMGLPGMSALDMSRVMLEQCGNSLVKLASMPVREMMRRFKGVGEAKAVGLAAAFELGLRCRSELERMEPVRSVRASTDAYTFIRGDIEMLPYEEFWVLLLSRANVIMAKRLIGRGGVSATVVDIKLILREAIDHLASGIILVHNHPSGNIAPSGEDDRITRRVVEASALLDIKVLDHIIVSAKGYYSYNDNGRL